MFLLPIQEMYMKLKQQRKIRWDRMIIRSVGIKGVHRILSRGYRRGESPPPPQSTTLARRGPILWPFGKKFLRFSSTIHRCVFRPLLNAFVVFQTIFWADRFPQSHFGGGGAPLPPSMYQLHVMKTIEKYERELMRERERYIFISYT